MPVKKKPRISRLPEKIEAWLQKLAPPGMSDEAGAVYILIRFAHFALLASLLPLALFYWKFEGLLHNETGPQVWVSFSIAVLWAAFNIAMSGYLFPPTAGRSVFTLAAILANGVTGASLAGYNPFFGAYQVLLTSLAAQVLLLAWGAAYLVYHRARYRVSKFGLPSWYPFFLLGLGGMLGFCWWSLKGPYFARLAAGVPVWAAGLCVLSFLLQVGMEIRNIVPLLGATDEKKRKAAGVGVAYDGWVLFYGAGMVANVLFVVAFIMVQTIISKASGK